MALAISDTRTIFTTNDTVGGWDEATTSVYTDPAEDGIKEGAGFVAYDVDIETLYNFEVSITIPTDMTGYHYGGWLRVTNPSGLDTKALGGMQLALRDGSGNESYWYVGGGDTYFGGWVYFVCDFTKTPDANSGTPAVLTNALDLGVGFKCLTKTLNDNCQMDLMHYGTNTQGLIITGSQDTGTYGTDKAWNEAYDINDTANSGIIAKQAGSYVLKGKIQLGDAAGTLTTLFEDKDTILFFADLPVDTTFYEVIVKGNGTGTTDVRLGVKVGTGDTAVGSNGNIIKSANTTIPWKLDLSDSNITTAKIYGTTFANMIAGSTVANTNVEMISTTLDQSGQISIGVADIFNSTISNSADTNGAILVPSADAHVLRKSSFNNNSRAIEIDTYYAAGYTFNNLIFSGNTFDVNNSSGSTQDVNKANGSNPSTYTGTLVNFLATFTLTLTNLIGGSIMSVTIVNSSTRTELKYELLTGTSTTYSHAGGEVVDILLNALDYDPNLSDIYDLTLDNADQSIKFQVVDDLNYENL